MKTEKRRIGYYYQPSGLINNMTGFAGERAEKKIKKVFAETRELYKTLLEIKGEEK